MNEGEVSKTIVGLLNHYGHCQKHEDKYETGIPDLSYAIKGSSGWIELKYLKKWPKRGGPVQFKRFTSKQRNWLKKRGRHCYKCFLLAVVEKELFIFFHHNIDDIGSKANVKEFRTRSNFRCPWPLNKETAEYLIEFLTL